MTTLNRHKQQSCPTTRPPSPIHSNEMYSDVENWIADSFFTTPSTRKRRAPFTDLEPNDITTPRTPSPSKRRRRDDDLGDEQTTTPRAFQSSVVVPPENLKPASHRTSSTVSSSPSRSSHTETSSKRTFQPELAPVPIESKEFPSEANQKESLPARLQSILQIYTRKYNRGIQVISKRHEVRVWLRNELRYAG